MKILFYVVNGEGLGHLNRSIIIADMLKKAMPHLDIAFMTNSKFNYWLDQKGYTYFKIEKKNYYEEIYNIITDYKPNAIIWDASYNTGILGTTFNFPLKHIFVFRKYKNNLIDKFIKSSDYEHIDLILLPHSIDEFKGYSVPPKILESLSNSEKIKFIGPLVRKLKINSDVSKKYKIINNQLVILASAGGGGDKKSKEYFDLNLKLKENLTNENINFIIISGPYNKIPNDSVVKFEQNFLELMNCADLVISQVGYNTINELIYTKTPSLLYPVDKEDDDQFERTNLLVYKGVSKSIANLDIVQLTNLIKELNNSKEKLSMMKNNFSELEMTFNSNLTPKLILEELKTPLKIPIFHQCNNNCSFCFQIGKGGDRKRKEVVFNQLQEWKNDNKESYFREEVIFTGGESTLRDNLDVLIDYAKQLDYKYITIESNGRAFSNLEYCKKIIDAGANKFIINIFGKTSEEHDKITKVPGSFEQTVKGIRNLRELKQEVDVRLFDGKSKFISIAKPISDYPTKSIYLRLTDKCNSRCIICDWWNQENKSSLPLEKVKNILFEAFVLDFNHIKITGGEASLYHNLIEVFEFSKLLGFKIEYATNAVLNNNEVIKYSKLLDEVMLTLHSDDKDIQKKITGVDSFDKITEFIQKIKISNPEIRVGVNCVITKINYDHISDLPIILDRLGVDNLYFSQVDCLSQNSKNKVISKSNLRLNKVQMKEFYLKIIPNMLSEKLKINISFNPFFFDLVGKSKIFIINKSKNNEFLEELENFSEGKYGKIFHKKVPCVVPNYTLDIMPNGDVFPCCGTLTILEAKIGNIFEKNLHDIYYSSEAISVRRKVKSKNFEYCDMCKDFFEISKNSIK